MNGYDGPTLRSVRESAGVPLRRVARQASMSHGHLSKVERGEPGRPVTPAVLAAYEQATGVKLTGMAGHGSDDPQEGGWRRGQLSEARRRTLRAKVAAVAAGGPLGDQLERILDGTGRLTVPAEVADADVAQVEWFAALCTRVDMRFGGAVADQPARAQLKWAVDLLKTGVSKPLAGPLHAAVGCLAQRAGWAAFDAASHDVARSLFTVGLYVATTADDPDLRAHLIADIAAQHNYLGYPDECLYLVRLGEVDERVGPAVRTVINGVKARAYAVLGNASACHRQLSLAEDAQAEVGPAPGWLATVATPAHLHATTGQALATLARRTDSEDVRLEARTRLRVAIDQLDPIDQARSAAMCMAHLAALHLDSGQLDEGVVFGRRLLDTAAGIRSSRLTDRLAAVHAAASAHAGEVAVKELVVDLDALLPTE